MVDVKDSLNTPWHNGKKAEVGEIVELHLHSRSVEPFTLDIESAQNSCSSFSNLKYLKNTRNGNLTDSVENLITYSSQKNDLNIHEEQYISLKSFLAACNGTYRMELMSVLFPIFSVFVIDLLEMGQQTPAINFFNKYSCDHEETYKTELETILQLLNSNDASTQASFAELKSRKFSLRLGGKIFGYLMQHLRNNNHSLLLQAINRNADIKMTEESQLDVGESLNEDVMQSRSDTTSDDDDNEVRILQECMQKIENVSKTKPSVTLYSFTNAFQGLSAVKFSPNSNVICAGFEDSSVRLWSLNMKKLGQVKQKEASTSKPGSSNMESSSSESIVLRGHKGPVFAVQFLPEGSAVLSASEDTSVRLWSVQSQTSLVEYKGHNYPVWDISAGCKGSYFVSASQDRTARLWSTEYAFPLRIFAGHQNSVDCVQFHPNGNYIASGSSDKTCRLWDLQTAQFVRVFVGHQAAIYTATFSPDGTYLVSAGEDNRVIVWDVRNGKMLQDLKGHSDTLYSVAFSKDGSMLVSGGLDNSIRVWNAEAMLKHGRTTEEQSSNDSLGYLISAYSTKATSVLEMQFSQGNLLLAAGLHETR